MTQETAESPESSMKPTSTVTAEGGAMPTAAMGGQLEAAAASRSPQEILSEYLGEEASLCPDPIDLVHYSWVSPLGRTISVSALPIICFA